MFTELLYENNDFSGFKADFYKLHKVKFIKCSFRSADFSDVLLDNCYFDACDFTGSRLNGSIIKSCAFVNCIFRYANFLNTALDDCKMTGSSFPNATFKAFTITAGNWSYTVFTRLILHSRKSLKDNIVYLTRSCCFTDHYLPVVDVQALYQTTVDVCCELRVHRIPPVFMSGQYP